MPHKIDSDRLQDWLDTLSEAELEWVASAAASHLVAILYERRDASAPQPLQKRAPTGFSWPQLGT